MMALVGSLEAFNTKMMTSWVHIDFRYICVVGMRVLILILRRIRLNPGFYNL
jgi:hypothetical protein